MILQIMQCARQRDKRAHEAAWKFKNKKLSICTKEYPQIGEFPVPIQKLLAQELNAVEERIEEGKEIHQFDETLQCSCRYLIPC